MNFSFISEYLTVVKKDRQLLINIWKPIKEGKELIFLYNNQFWVSPEFNPLESDK